MRRRALLLMAVTAAALVVASGIAIAEAINGTSGADNLRGTNEADLIDGRAGNDTIRALEGNDKVTGGRDNDTLQETAGNDTYFFDDGWGSDRIYDLGGGVDTLDFSAISNRAVLVDLDPDSASAEASSGKNTLNLTDTQVFIENVRGGSLLDDIHGNSATNRLLGRGGVDFLHGRDGRDTISGGPQADDIYGEGGDDTLLGGSGDDTYDYRVSNWGEDTIIDEASAATPNRLLFVGSGSFPGLRVDLRDNPSFPEVSNGSFSTLSTIEWNGTPINDVSTTSSTDDTITGNDAANTIFSDFGDDRVFGLEGDDEIHVEDHPSLDPDPAGDEVRCGGGFDEVHYDEGDITSNSSTHQCEVRIKDGVAQP